MTLTTEELGRLRVPLAALDGFDPVGLAVHVDQADTGIWWGTVCDEDLSHDQWGVYTAHGGAPKVRWPWTRQMSVDLADPATADRVVRWLAARDGKHFGATAPRWYWHTAVRCWVLGHTVLGEQMSSAFSADGRCTEHEVPALADIDPTDDRRLPDGSRFVDRLALALVAVAAP